MNKISKDYAPLILRVTVGLIMILPGISKLNSPEMIIGLLGSLGFPLPTILGWLLIISEIAFGIAIILGWKLKYAIWPPVIILAVALIFVSLPALGSGPMAMINVLFHLLSIGTLISLYLTGPGAHAIKQ